MNQIQQLRNALTQSFHSTFRIDEVRKGIYQVFIPAFYPDGDMIDIFLKPESNGNIQVCDMGLTLMRLSYTYDLNTETKQKIFKRILNENGANFQEGNIFISASASETYAVIMQFIQLIAKISDMKQYQRMVSHSQFYENFKDYIFTAFQAYHPEENVTPIHERSEINVDFVLTKEGNKPIFLYPVRGTSKATTVVMSLLSLQEIGIPFTGVVVHEDFESLPDKTQKFITNAADKQFTDFKQFQDRGEKYLHRLTAV